MVSAPGCWQAYGEVAVRAMQEPRTALRHSHVDCFAAQHPTDAATDRRQRQSVAVHLVALCLRLEHHIQGIELSRRRQQVSDRTIHAAGLPDWPFLEPPDAERFCALGEQWPRAVWQAWSRHHGQVRTWTRLALGTR